MPHHPDPVCASHLATGARGEATALSYLERRGFRLLARNWRPRGRYRSLELDLVGEWESALVIVEVKTRRIAAYDEGEGPAGLGGFTLAKRKNILRAAGLFIAERDMWEAPCRIDLICVTFTKIPPDAVRVEHYRNVIECGQTLDSGNAPWQPW